jgi:hypothetical protein
MITKMGPDGRLYHFPNDDSPIGVAPDDNSLKHLTGETWMPGVFFTNGTAVIYNLIGTYLKDEDGYWIPVTNENFNQFTDEVLQEVWNYSVMYRHHPEQDFRVICGESTLPPGSTRF